MIHKHTVFLLLAAAFSASPPVSATDGYALVIGNSDYLFGPLDNPVNDADLIEGKLEQWGFKVAQSRRNLTKAEMSAAIKAFVDQLHGSDTVGLFYFAGHGVQIDGKNYLLAIDSSLGSKDEIAASAITVGEVRALMEAAPNAINILILDACRNNPFAGQDATMNRGLMRVTPAAEQETLIAYSAMPGQLANDGNGDHSPFAATFAAIVDEPDIRLEEGFRKMRAAFQEFPYTQRPWLEGLLTHNVYLASTLHVTYMTKAEGSQSSSEAGDWLLFAGAMEDASSGVRDFLFWVTELSSNEEQSDDSPSPLSLARINGKLNFILGLKTQQADTLRGFIDDARGHLALNGEDDPNDDYENRWRRLTAAMDLVLVNVARVLRDLENDDLGFSATQQFDHLIRVLSAKEDFLQQLSDQRAPGTLYELSVLERAHEYYERLIQDLTNVTEALDIYLEGRT